MSLSSISLINLLQIWIGLGAGDGAGGCSKGAISGSYCSRRSELCGGQRQGEKFLVIGVIVSMFSLLSLLQRGFLLAQTSVGQLFTGSTSFLDTPALRMKPNRGGVDSIVLLDYCVHSVKSIFCQ